MLVVRYSKAGGAEYVSHLDALRHIQRSVIRGKIPVEYSKGFNPHMLIFMSAPISVGLTSYAEYFFIQTDMGEGEFFERFNKSCPKGFTAQSVIEVNKNPNIQAIVTSAEYKIEMELTDDEIASVLNKESFLIVDKRGVEREVKSRIVDLKKGDNGLIARLSCGNETLRADIFAEKLGEMFDKKFGRIVKTECFVGDEKADEYIREHFRPTSNNG